MSAKERNAKSAQAQKPVRKIPEISADSMQAFKTVIANLQKEAEEARKEEQRKKAQREQKMQQAQAPVPPKYYLTNNIIEIDDHILHQIVAAKDIPSICVREGDLGGFIEGEQNLSHRGTCWVFAGNVYERAFVTDGATVRGKDVRVHGQAKLSGSFIAYDEVHLHGQFQGTGCGKAMGRIDAGDNTVIMESGCAAGGTLMRHHATIRGNARASGQTVLCGNVILAGDYESYGGYYSTGTAGRGTSGKSK